MTGRRWIDRPGGRWWHDDALPKRQTLAGLLVFAICLNGCSARLIISPEKAQSAEQLAQDQRECEAEVQTMSRNVATAGKALVMIAPGALAGAIVGVALGLGLALSGDNFAGPHPEAQILLPAFLGGAVGVVAGAIFLPTRVVADERNARASEFRRCMEERGYSVGADRPSK